MATTIKLKNSVTTTNAPSSLVQGEVAINITDKKVWVGNAATTPIQLLGDGGSVNFTTVDTTNLQVTNIKAKDGTASASIANSTGAFTVAAAFAANGGATLGDASGDALTINSSAVSIPNGLNFDSNTLVIDAANNRVGVNNATPTTALDVIGTATISTNLAFTGTGNRITGDFSNATLANRVAFQTSTTNGSTSLSVIPNGTGANAGVFLESDSAVTNSSRMVVQIVGGSDARITSAALGSGTALPMTFYTGGSERLRIDTSGNVGIGTTSPTQKLQVEGFIQTGAGASTGGGIQYPYASNASSRSWRTKNDEVSFGDFVIQQSTTQTGSTYANKARIDQNGNFEFDSGYGSLATAFGCRAWVNFNGTGTPTIRASGNVTSITDNGAGDYTVNLTTAMPDINYAPIISNSKSPDIDFVGINTNTTTGGDVAPTTTTCRISFSQFGVGGKDPTYISFAIFR